MSSVSVPDKMIEAAVAEYWRSMLPTARQSMRAALEVAGVGELIEALMPFSIYEDGIGTNDDIERARAVLEKLGMSEANASNELKASEKE